LDRIVTKKGAVKNNDVQIAKDKFANQHKTKQNQIEI
jgi:hypothetical protein